MKGHVQDQDQVSRPGTQPCLKVASQCKLNRQGFCPGPGPRPTLVPLWPRSQTHLDQRLILHPGSYTLCRPGASLTLVPIWPWCHPGWSWSKTDLNVKLIVNHSSCLSPGVCVQRKISVLLRRCQGSKGRKYLFLIKVVGLITRSGAFLCGYVGKRFLLCECASLAPLQVKNMPLQDLTCSGMGGHSSSIWMDNFGKDPH